ncbi:hypothetical protein OKW22_000578 [Bacilli bacterium PM5-3]|nr:hypothetical protein [Bacilli bacterium PM5-3]MDH6603192.1 hypothetical protein [Bacilli bacterium PM5-9]
MKVKLDLSEIKRYLKYDSDSIDEVTNNNINKAIKLVEENASLKYTYNRYSININENNIEVNNTILNFKSNDLARHLDNCDEVILLVATLGLPLDNLIKKLEITDLSLAYIVNAIAVEYLEKCLDKIQDELNIEKNKTSRFSIGYGDLKLEYQSDFIKVLDATKKIGVNVLDTNLMIPSKSVSAIIGLSNKKIGTSLKKCDKCLDNGMCSGKCFGKE